MLCILYHSKNKQGNWENPPPFVSFASGSPAARLGPLLEAHQAETKVLPAASSLALFSCCLLGRVCPSSWNLPLVLAQGPLHLQASPAIQV